MMKGSPRSVGLVRDTWDTRVCEWCRAPAPVKQSQRRCKQHENNHHKSDTFLVCFPGLDFAHRRDPQGAG